MILPDLRKIKLRVSYKGLLVLVSICMVSIFVVFLGFQYYVSIEDYISEKLIAIEKSHLEQTGNNIDAQLNQIKNITDSISQNDDFLSLVAEYDIGDFTARSKLRKSMEIMLGKSANINRNILSIAIFTKQNVITKGNLPLYDLSQTDLFTAYAIEDIVSSEAFPAVFNMPSSFNVSGNDTRKIKDLLERYSFSVNLIRNGENIGTLFVVSTNDLFGTLLSQSSNKVVFSQNEKLLYNNTKKSNEMISGMYTDLAKNPENALSIRNHDEIMICTSSIGFGVNIGFILEKQEYLKRVSGVKIFFLFFIIALLIVSFLLSGLISKAVTKPLKKLTSKVKRYNLLKKKEPDELKDNKAARFSLRESILVFLVAIVTLSTTVLILTTYILFSNIIDAFMKETTQNAFNQTVGNLNFYFNNAIYASENIIYADSVQASLGKPEIDELTYDKLGNTLLKGLPLYNGKAEISLYNKYGTEVISFINKPVTATLKMELSGFSNNYVFRQTQKDIDGSFYVPFYMKINNIEDYQTLGYLECRLNELDIGRLYNKLKNDYSEVFIINSANIIISHSNKNLIGTVADLSNLKSSQGKVKLLFKAALLDTGYTIIETYGENTVEYDKTKFLLNEIYLLVIILLITFITAFLISRNLPSAFKNLNDRISSINLDNLNVELAHSSPIDEVNQLNIAFNDMSIRIEHLLEEVIVSTKKTSELEKVKNQAEITSLQAQINPHFLYNTFENIHWMIRNDNKKEALFMIKCLSSMLRFIAKREPIIVNIGEEIGYTKTYMEIMKTRYEDELEFDIHIDEKLLDFKIIKLILQPIIENAIEHGIRPKGKKGKITISGRLTNNSTIEFIIKDNGIGMSKEKLDSLNEILSKQSDPDTIGLQNVQARIKLFYGDAYGMTITSEPEEGSVVTICIPAHNS